MSWCSWEMCCSMTEGTCRGVPEQCVVRWVKVHVVVLVSNVLLDEWRFMSWCSWAMCCSMSEGTYPGIPEQCVARWVKVHVVVFLFNVLLDEWRLVTLCNVFSVFLNSSFNLLLRFPDVGHDAIITTYSVLHRFFLKFLFYISVYWKLT